jgi:type II secretory pathway pseudopilin PulG
MYAPPPKSRKAAIGFTLAEVLISLAILGEIATFTIPKVLLVQQNARNNAVVKETAGMVSEAFRIHQLNGQVSGSTKAADLYQNLNYVSATNDSSWLIDGRQNETTEVCDSAYLCLKLHNGATIYPGTYSFAGTQSTQAIMFQVDPDGKVTDGTTNGPGKSVQFFLYYNGRLTT